MPQRQTKKQMMGAIDESKSTFFKTRLEYSDKQQHIQKEILILYLDNNYEIRDNLKVMIIF